MSDTRPTEPESSRRADESSEGGPWERAVDQALLRIYEPLVSSTSSLPEIASAVLDEATTLTSSHAGFVSSVDLSTGDQTIHALLDRSPPDLAARGCAPSPGIVPGRSPEDARPGLLQYVLHRRAPCLRNALDSNAAAAWEAIGGPRIQRFLAVPAMIGDELVGQVALANSTREYTERDLSALGRLARVYALAAQRLRAARSLRESEKSHRELLDNLNEGLWVIDVKGNTTFVNEQMASLLGYTQEEMLGQHLFEFMDDRGRKLCESNIERRRRGVREVHDFEFRRKDGTRVYTLIQTSPLTDSEGRYRGAIAGVIDISDRKQVEDELRAERNFTDAILSIAGALVVVLDTAGRIIRFNGMCERVTGYSFEEVHDRPLWEVLIVPEEVEVVREVFSRLRAGEFPNQHENWWVAKDGSRKRIAWSNTALSDADGSVTFVIGTGIDVTELREVETRLRALNESLEQQVRDRTAEAERRAAQIHSLAFKLGEAEQNERRRLAGVLHDHLQQTLVAARFRMSGLRRLEGCAEAQSMIAELDTLLSEAIEASRSLTVDLNPSMLCEDGLAAGLRWLSRSVEAKHGLRVELHTEDEGQLSRPLAVFLFEAVRELLFNVVKHGEVTEARVFLGRDADGNIEVRVEDHGAGFDPQNLSSTGPTRGFGLWGIRERLELHGGALLLDSRPGGGTRVRVVVPPEGSR